MFCLLVLSIGVGKLGYIFPGNYVPIKVGEPGIPGELPRELKYSPGIPGFSGNLFLTGNREFPGKMQSRFPIFGF